MKTFRYYILIALIGLITFSCSNDDDYSLNDIWITIGNIETNNDGYVIVTDGGTRLYPSTSAVPDYPLEDGQRLFVNFTILGDGEPDSGIDHYVRINDLSNILTKEIIEYNLENADSIGNDPIWFNNQDEDIWIANNYLNVFFNYEGSPYTTHFINLVYDVDSLTTENGIPIYEIKHNKNDDPYTKPPLRAFVSFDLTELQNEGESEITFLLRAIGPSGEYELEKEYTYVYGDTVTQAKVTQITYDETVTSLE